jgi:hypothetical protein
MSQTHPDPMQPATEVPMGRLDRGARIDRRTVLRGAGASLALPLLSVMKPLATAAQVASQSASPLRLAWIFFPNGTNAERWFPTGTGTDWTLSPSLEPLAEFRKDINVLKGLAQVNGQSLGDGPGDHARSAAVFLTGAHPYKTAGSKIRAGRSVDQIAADTYGRNTRLASIELGTEEGRDAGACDSGYSCAYSNNVSWRSESLPTGKEIKPKNAFDRLFGAAGGGSGKDRGMKASILDFVNDQRKHLLGHVASEDARKLDEYFTSVREIEQRITKCATPVELPEGTTEPTEKPSDITEHIRLMYDLMVLAFQTDTTRIATFMLANEGSNRTFPMIEVKDGHHQISHHENNQDNIAKIAKIDRYYSEQFAYFVKRLRETPDGEGNLLDHSMILYGGAICDGNRHDHHDLPLLLAGRAGRSLATGKILEFPQYTPLNNLFRTMLDYAGVDQGNFGDASGILSLG